mgnify:CR=1 FL=1
MIVDCCSAPGLKPYNEALEQILSSIVPIREIELLPLEDCLERILAEDLLSTNILPPWHCSAMDGYALNSGLYDANRPLTMVGSSFAGHPYDGKVNIGECIRIMTGACLPADCDAVVMQENVQLKDTKIIIEAMVEPWQHVRKAGSEVTIGEIVLNQGQRINPRNIGVAASLGLSKIPVFRQLRVAIFSTGDELVPPGGTLLSGQIYDSNRYSVAAVCKRLGYEVIDYGLVADDKEKIKAVMLEAAAIADVLLTSGGVSVGEADYVKPIIEEIGHIDLWKVAIKPGKPIAIGSIQQCKFFGLPGNPVSAMVTLNLLVQPAMQKLSGMELIPATIISAICDTKLNKKAGRRDFQRGTAYTGDQGNWHVSSTGSQGSAKLTSLSQGNCYIVLDENCTGVRAGEKVNVQLFDEVIR